MFKLSQLGKVIVILFSAYVLAACGAAGEDFPDGEPGSNPDSGGGSGSPVFKTTGSFSESLSRSDFEVRVNFSGDDNEDSLLTVSYCNETDSPGCDPLLGNSQYMSRTASGSYMNIIAGLTAPYDTNDVINIKLVVTDPDGVIGTSTYTHTVALQSRDLTVSNPLVTNITPFAFDVSLDFQYDDNANSNIVFYFCNETDSPGCDPMLGNSQSLTRGASDFTYSFSGLASPYDMGDAYNYIFVATDADGIQGSSSFAQTFNVPTDTNAPTFSGASGLNKLSGTSAQILWSAASDDFTPAGDIVYEICQSLNTGGCASSFTANYSTTGATNYTVNGLTDGVDYYFVVRAKDNVPNQESNTVEVSRLNLEIIDITKGLGYHTCALYNTGNIKCWGKGSYGQLGNGSTGNKYNPYPVSGITNAIKVTAGESHTCALLSTGQIKCWGRSNYGQLGNGSTSTRYTSYPVSGISNAVDISAGSFHTCAVLSTGQLKCWGRSNSGQLGNGSTSTKYTPYPVTGITNGAKVFAGYYHTCVILSTGAMKCMGYGQYGQLGNGSTSTRYTPYTVTGISNAVEAGLGRYHTCLLLSTGQMKCMGYGGWGHLGNGSTSIRYTPYTVTGISNAVSMSVGYNFSCAVLSTGAMKCWGQSTYGQLGNGSTSAKNSPYSVTGISNASIAGSGYDFGCTLLSDGTMKCWGRGNNGQLGIGSTSSKLTPAEVSF